MGPANPRFRVADHRESGRESDSVDATDDRLDESVAGRANGEPRNSVETPQPADAGAHEDAAETVEAVIRRRFAEVLGGWYGSLETALPTVAFVIVWVIRSELNEALIASAAAAGVLLIVRLIIGGSLRYVFTSVVGVAIAAFFALRSGRAEDAFLPGLLMNGAYLVAALVSILARWPLIGFLVAIGDPDYVKDPTGWRRDPAMVRVCIRLTWVIVVMFAIRVSIMLPLYLASEVAWLGVARVALGWPLYLGAVVVMGMMLTIGRTDREDGAEQPTSTASGRISGSSDATRIDDGAS